MECDGNIPTAPSSLAYDSSFAGMFLCNTESPHDAGNAARFIPARRGSLSACNAEGPRDAGNAARFIPARRASLSAKYRRELKIYFFARII